MDGPADHHGAVPSGRLRPHRAGRALSHSLARDEELDDEPIARHYGETSRTWAGDVDADYDARAPEDTYEAYLH